MASSNLFARLLFLISAAGLALAAFDAQGASDTHASKPAAWVAYQKVMSRYYYLDQQPFKQITCKVKESSLIGYLARSSKAASLLKGRIGITDTLDDYTLIYNKASGLSFRDPTLTYQILSAEGLADPDTVRHAILGSVEGFQAIVREVDAELSILFAAYDSPREDEGIKRVDSGPKEVTIAFDDGDTATIRGLHWHDEKYSSKGTSIFDSEDEVAAGGKQVPIKSTFRSDTPGKSTYLDDNVIDYQTVGGVVFPRSIQEQNSYTPKDQSEHKFTLSITLYQCAVQK